MKLLRQSFEETGVIVLSTGEAEHGTPYWAYAHIPATNIEAYAYASEHGEFALEDFGTVICWGEESTPPTDIQQQMHALYGYSETFATEIILEIQKHPAGRDMLARIEAYYREQ